MNKATKQKLVPIWEHATLTLEEVAAYSVNSTMKRQRLEYLR